MIKTGTPNLRHTRLLSYRMYLVPGVLLGEDVALLSTCYMGVDLCRHNGTMPEQLLDIPNIDAFFQQ